MRIAAVLNPFAGSFNPFASFETAGKAVARAFPDCEIFVTRSEREAVRQFKAFAEEGVDTVLVAGGDGAIHLAAKHLCETPIQLGILPIGTANNIASSLGIPADVEGALQVVSRGRIRAVDIGRVRSHIFLESAGIGFHAEAMRVYNRGREKSIVRSAYAFLKTVSEIRPFAVRLNLDGTKINREVYQVTISNFPRYGLGLNIAPQASVDDGLFDVTLIGKAPRRRMAEYILAATALGNLSEKEKVEHFRARTVRIGTDRPMPMHLDANIRVSTPCTISMLSGGIKFFVP